ncbi:Barwin-like endoglucanase [Cynara cardunculus var. scolymus]|uniref:Barwin-like endoglucanase n=1 Tax=Cynara cardunculus var. scolymus TaxID=59895 RepID=A0A103YM02_CYNCS|nr:Barwin-like endoglucanase [Cynara cardunculus var. scolymus]
MVSTPFIIITIFLAYFSSCLCVVLHNNNTFGLKDFEPALATWYGDETGAGSGGACGWEDDVKDPPLSSMISAGNANIFLNGKGCGHCFQACSTLVISLLFFIDGSQILMQIFCNQPPYCSGEPIKVTVSDECPGACNNVPFHFDLSGFAFGAMALPGTRITFKVHEDCNPYWFATAIEYADGDGGFGSIEIAAGGSQNFVGMDNIWGAVWKKDIDPSFIGPFSFRLTSVDGKTVVATNVIPATFSPGSKYSSSVNF